MIKGMGFYDSIIIKLPMPVEFTNNTLKYSLSNNNTSLNNEVITKKIKPKKDSKPKKDIKKIDITKEELDIGKSLMDLQDQYSTETDKQSKKYLKDKFNNLKKEHLKKLNYEFNFDIFGNFIDNKKSKPIKQKLKEVVGPVKFSKPPINKKPKEIGKDVKTTDPSLFDENDPFNKEWKDLTNEERKQRLRNARVDDKKYKVKIINEPTEGTGIKKRGRPKKSI